MAEKVGVLDLAVDLLKERLNDGKALLKERYKGVRPFRQPQIPDRELLYNYLKLTDDQKMLYRQSFGGVWDMYEKKMEQIRSKISG